MYFIVWLHFIILFSKKRRQTYYHFPVTDKNGDLSIRHCVLFNKKGRLRVISILAAALVEAIFNANEACHSDCSAEQSKSTLTKLDERFLLKFGPHSYSHNFYSHRLLFVTILIRGI